ncbi:restriction endonuclease [Thermomonospora amylolytica]|uniref:restriction endonuclease n=1 Tax=Thermomonospora amylolytica TaxID=1411117 RepID=UPI000E6D3E26|nr:restriction endonuclease [Thermomonospora amylolytica]
MTTKRVNPAVLHPLKEALTNAFWYKKDLRAFLTSCLGRGELIAHLDWTDYKRSIVAQLVDSMAANQHRYFEDLLNLLLATADIADPSHLKRLEDGKVRYEIAVESLDTLRKVVEPYRRMRTEEEEAARRREAERAQAEMQRAINQKLDELRSEFYEIVGLSAQARGYALEKFLNGLFALYDIDAKAPFRITGEQIDGAFTFEGEFLVEAKWHDEPTPVSDLDIFAGKVERKLDNTLGLFVSMNGYQDSAIEIHSRRRPVMILMDGSDLSAVIEGRIPLPDLLRRKRQHAARTGDIFFRAYDILS